MPKRKEWVVYQFHKSHVDAKKEITKRCNNFRDHDFYGMTIKSIKLMPKDPYGNPNVYVKPKGSRAKGRRYYKIVLRPKKKRKRRKK